MSEVGAPAEAPASSEPMSWSDAGMKVIETQQRERVHLERRKRLSTAQSGLIFGDSLIEAEAPTMADAPARVSLRESGFELARQATHGCLFLPESRLRMCWDFTAILLIVFIALSLPYRLAFDTAPANGNASSVSAEEVGGVSDWAVVDFVIDIFFIMDILLNFRTAYVDSVTGLLVTRADQIAIAYIRSWFLLDVIASFPFDWIVSGVDFSNASRTDEEPALAGLPGMLRLFKLFKLPPTYYLLPPTSYRYASTLQAI